MADLKNIFAGDNPPIPKRKPGPIQLRIGDFMRSSQGKFPLTELGDTPGSPGDRVKLTNITYEDEEAGTQTVGAFIPKVDPVRMPGLTDLLKRLGREDLMTNVINITMSDEMTPDKFEKVTRHEFKHSGIAKLRGETGEFSLNLPSLEFPSSVNKQGTLTPEPSRLTEEDLVRLLEARTDVSRIEKTQEYFRELRSPKIVIPVVDMLKNSAILGAILSLQKQADLFSQSKGAPPSLIHFSSDEELDNMIRKGIP